MDASKLFTLKLTAAVALDGILHRAGTVVDLAEGTAKNLLHRGKAVLHEVEQEAEKLADELRQAFEGDGSNAPAPAPAPAPAAPAPAPAVPTREDLDGALDALPDNGEGGSYTDPEYVVNAMRAHFGDVFTAADEARVRELVVVPDATPKPSAGLNVAQLRDALAAKNIPIPEGVKLKADLAALLDAAAAADTPAA